MFYHARIAWIPLSCFAIDVIGGSRGNGCLWSLFVDIIYMDVHCLFVNTRLVISMYMSYEHVWIFTYMLHPFKYMLHIINLQFMQHFKMVGGTQIWSNAKGAVHLSPVYISYFHWCLLHFSYYHTSWTKRTCACVNCFYCLPCKIKIVLLSYCLQIWSNARWRDAPIWASCNAQAHNSSF